jgi:hypothetical protein
MRRLAMHRPQHTPLRVLLTGRIGRRPAHAAYDHRRRQKPSASPWQTRPRGILPRHTATTSFGPRLPDAQEFGRGCRPPMM